MKFLKENVFYYYKRRSARAPIDNINMDRAMYTETLQNGHEHAAASTLHIQHTDSEVVHNGE